MVEMRLMSKYEVYVCSVNGIFIFLMQNVKPLEKATLTYLVRRKGAEA